MTAFARRAGTGAGAGGAVVTSSKSNERICCGRLSSRTSKSPAVRPFTMAPLPSRTTTSTTTTLTFERKAGAGVC